MPQPIQEIERQATVQYLTHLPKAELHLHLEGTITPATLVRLSQLHDEEPVTLAEAEALYIYKDFHHFLDTWAFVCAHIQTPDDYAIIAGDMFESLAQQGVKHAEVFVAVGGMLTTRPHLRVDDVFAAIEAVRMLAEEHYGISALWIVDASRKFGAQHVGEVFDHAARLRERYPAVVGVGIGGREAHGPCRLFKDTYVKAKQRGLRLTAHCGEATGAVEGPKEIWDALAMGVERLGHAFCAQYDDSLLNELARTGTVLELNVTSNLRTGVCQTVERHPIRRYFDRGLTCTINSDDPAMFGSNVLDEYVMVHERLRFSLEEIKILAENSFKSSFLSEKERARFVAMVKVY